MKKTYLIPTLIIGVVGSATVGAEKVSAAALVSGFSGGQAFTSYYGGTQGDVIGFRFVANQSGKITALGLLNDPIDGVLNSTHKVGLWDTASQSLLGSVFVDSTGTNIDGFIYSFLLSPIGIVAGNNYTLGALDSANDNDGYLSNLTSIGLNSISGTVGVFPQSASLGFVFPKNESGLARLGPNALFTASTSIPTPALLPGLIGMGVAALRKRKQEVEAEV